MLNCSRTPVSLGNGDVLVTLTATANPTTTCTNPGGTSGSRPCAAERAATSSSARVTRCSGSNAPTACVTWGHTDRRRDRCGEHGRVLHHRLRGPPT